VLLYDGYDLIFCSLVQLLSHLLSPLKYSLPLPQLSESV
jgi:hypothetical protein